MKFYNPGGQSFGTDFKNKCIKKFNQCFALFLTPRHSPWQAKVDLNYRFDFHLKRLNLMQNF